MSALVLWYAMQQYCCATAVLQYLVPGICYDTRTRADADIFNNFLAKLFVLKNLFVLSTKNGRQNGSSSRLEPRTTEYVLLGDAFCTGAR